MARSAAAIQFALRFALASASRGGLEQEIQIHNLLGPPPEIGGHVPPAPVMPESMRIKNPARQLDQNPLLESIEGAQDRMKVKKYDAAAHAKEEFDNYGRELAKELGGRVSLAPIKGEKRAEEKVKGKYRGDWSEIRDLLRMTIIVPQSKLQEAADRALSHFSVAEGYKRAPYFQEKTAQTDPCGYSGTTVFATVRFGILGEIQINTADIIYAKEGAKSRDVLQDLYDEVKTKSDLEGGEGHHLYELWRSPETAPDMKDKIASVSKAYYDYFRRGEAYWDSDAGRDRRDELRQLLSSLGAN